MSGICLLSLDTILSRHLCMRVEVSSLLCPCLWVLRGGDVFGSVARGSLYTVDPSASSATRLQPPTTTRARSLTHSLTRLPYLPLSPSLLYCLSHHCRSPLPPSPLPSSLPPFLTASLSLSHSITTLLPHPTLLTHITGFLSPSLNNYLTPSPLPHCTPSLSNALAHSTASIVHTVTSQPPLESHFPHPFCSP